MCLYINSNTTQRGAYASPRAAHERERATAKFVQAVPVSDVFVGQVRAITLGAVSSALFDYVLRIYSLRLERLGPTSAAGVVGASRRIVVSIPSDLSEQIVY